MKLNQAAEHQAPVTAAPAARRRAEPPVLATLGSENLLALQRSAGNGATAELLRTPAVAQRSAADPVLQRAGGHSGGVGPKGSYEIELSKSDFLKDSFVKGSLKSKFEFTVEAANAAASISAAGSDFGSPGKRNAGAKAEITLLKEKLHQELWLLTVVERKVKLGFELSRKKFDLSAGVDFKAATPLKWFDLSGSGKLTAVGVDWEKMQKNPDDVTLAELKFGVSGAPNFVVELGGSRVKVQGKLTAEVGFKPNWPRIVQEVLLRQAQTAGEVVSGTAETAMAGGAAEGAAATGAAVGEGAIGVGATAYIGAAAAIGLPLLSVAALGYAFSRIDADIQATVDGAIAGQDGRRAAAGYAADYATVMSGYKSGSGPGAVEAEQHLDQAMAQLARENPGKEISRQELCREILNRHGGYQQLVKELEKAFKEKYFANTVQNWEAAHRPDFSWLENLGEGWGRRGIFARNLRSALYAY